MRFIFADLLPLFGPLAFYLLWTAYARRKAEQNGGHVPTIRNGPMLWSIAAGFILMLASLLFVALSTGTPPEQGEYVAPRLEGGKILPPEFRRPVTKE